MSGSDEQSGWVSRVLGVTVPTGGGTSGPVDLSKAIGAWRDALDEVDSQISGLQKALKASDDDELHEIAEFGLNALTGNHKVRIQAALMEIGSKQDDPKAKSALTGLIDSFTSHIESDERIAVCDSNPFGVAMSIRNTLTPPLQQLKQALAG